jgi:DNA-directed RNA polymerase specialized sigma24 family protein
MSTRHPELTPITGITPDQRRPGTPFRASDRRRRGEQQQPRLTTDRLSTKVDDMAFVPTEEEAVPKDPAEGLAAVVALRLLADRLEAGQVERAVLEGWSWAEIAMALGVSRQAVHKKHAKRLRARGMSSGRGRV